MKDQQSISSQDVGFSVPSNQNLNALDGANLSLQQNQDGKTVIYPIVSISTKEVDAQFAAPGDMADFWSHITSELKKMYAPFKKKTNLVIAGGFGVVLTFLKYLFFFGIFTAPILRGWRFDIVRRIGLGLPSVPNLLPHSIFRYFKKGLVLIIMRAIYFLPHLIFIAISSKKMLFQIVEVGKWMFNKFWTGHEDKILDYLISLIPEMAYDLMMQLVMFTLYMIIIWPIYRITMVKYALGLIRGTGFLNKKVFMDSVSIFRKAAPMVLGIYFWCVLVDLLTALILFLLIFIPVIGWLALFFTPLILLFIKHWPKGYAYGLLARRLIEQNHLSVPNQEEAEGLNL